MWCTTGSCTAEFPSRRSFQKGCLCAVWSVTLVWVEGDKISCSHMLPIRSPVLFHYIHVHVYLYSDPSVCWHYCLTLKEQLHFLSSSQTLGDLIASPKSCQLIWKGFSGISKDPQPNLPMKLIIIKPDMVPGWVVSNPELLVTDLTDNLLLKILCWKRPDTYFA